MFAPLVNGVRADIDRQIDWARVEVHRQTRYTLLCPLSILGRATGDPLQKRVRSCFAVIVQR